MKRIVLTITSLFCSCFFMAATANPIVAPGGFNPNQVTISPQGPNMTIYQHTPTAFIHWDTFNIQKGEVTTFAQPSRSSVAINRVNSTKGASEIYGTLNANGRIILINQAGIYFGPTSSVNVGSIIASTSDMSKFDSQHYVFDIPSKYPNAAVINRGNINTTADYGLVALIGNRVGNDGNITAHAGTVIMGAGNKFTLDFTGDQLVNFSIDEASSNNKSSAQDIKDLGLVHMQAGVAQKVLDHAINTTHTPEATHFAKISNGDLVFSNGTIDVSGRNSGQHGGTVKLLATRVKVNHATINASGDSGGGEVLIGGNAHGAGPDFNATTTSVDANTHINASAINHGNGGKVIVWSNDKTQFYGSILAEGGILSGDGGFVETSGHTLDVANANINLLAPNGKTGTWLLDPTDLTISTGATSNVNFASDTYTGNSNANTSILNVTDLTTALNSANIVVQTSSGGTGSGSGDITAATSISWNNANTLTLSAYRNIVINSGVTISNSAGGSLVLQANNEGFFELSSSPEGVVTNNGTINMSGGGLVNIFYNPTLGINFRYQFPVTYTNAGNDTLTAYMLVNSILDLQGLNQNLHANYGLSKDLDAAGQTVGMIGYNNNLTPANSNNFTGQFNGQNHTISNLTLNYPSLDQVGLFSATNNYIAPFNLSPASPTGAIISNLGLINPNITGHNFVGGIVGLLGGQNSAGLNITSQSSVQNSYVSGGSISGASYVGGVVGYNLGTISTVYNTSSVSASTSNAGGIAGANVVSTNPTTSDSGVIQNAYNLGSVTGPTSGGIVGSNSSAGSTINQVVNSGYISGSTMGGIAGSNSGTITSAYWDTQTSGQNVGVGSGSAVGTTGQTTASLQASLPSGFSAPTWAIISGVSYPYLLDFYPNTPRVISGTTPVSGGETVVFASNGNQTDTATTGSNGYFYFLEKNGTIADNSPYLLYLSNAGTPGNVLGFTAASNGSMTALNFTANAIQVNTGSTGFSASDMATAIGSLSSTDILYSASLNNLTLGNATFPNVTLQTSGTGAFTIDKTISSTGTTTALNFNTPIILDTTSISTSGGQIYNNPVTLASTSTLASTNSGDISFASTLNGAFDLTVNTAGTTSFNDIVGGTAPLSSLTTDAAGSTSIGANITTTGAQTYHDTVVLGASPTLTSNTDIIFNNGINGAGKDLILTGLGNSGNNFTLSQGLTLANLTINGGSGVNTLSLQTTSPTQTWIINATNSGTVDISGITGTLSFNNINNLIGSGSNATLDVSALSSPSVNLTTGTASGITGTFSNIDNFVGTDTGSTANSTISGLGDTTITGANAGSSGANNFTGFGNLIGSGNNTFDFNANASITGNLTETSGSNTYNFSNGSSIGENLIGAGSDSLSVATFTTPVTVNLSGSSSLVNGTITGVTQFTGTDAGTGTPKSTLEGGDGTFSTWLFTSTNSGTINSTITFNNFGNIDNHANPNMFTFQNNANITGSLTGSGSDVLNLTATNSPTVNLTNNTINGIVGAFSGIGIFVGSGDSSLIGPSGNTTWNINSIAAGTVGSYQFNGFNNLIGGANVNTFVLNVDNSAISINGGTSGNNALKDSTGNMTSWIVSGTNAGNIPGFNPGFNVNFSNIQNIYGSTGGNTYTFNDGATLSGNIFGSGSDSLNISTYSMPVTINLAGPSSIIGGFIIGVNQFTGTDAGSGSNSTLEIAGSNHWTLNSTNNGSINSTITFNNFGNITGSSGTDTLDVSGLTSPTVNLSTNTTSGLSGIFNGMNNFIGAGISSSLVGPSSSSTTWNINSLNAGTVGGNTFSNFGNLIGSGSMNTLDLSTYSTPVLVNLSAGTATGISGTFSNMNNFIGSTASSNLIGPSGTTTWNINSTDSGTVGSNSFSNFGNLMGGTGNNTFAFSGNSSVSGIVNGGNTTNINTIDASGYGQPTTLTLTSNTSGTLNTLIPSMVASFMNINNAIGAPNSRIHLPTESTANTLVFKPAAGILAQLNNTFNFNFSQYNFIYSGLLGDTANLSHVIVNSRTPNSDGSITYNIDDPINVTFFGFASFTEAPPPIPIDNNTSNNNTNIAETLTQGITTGEDALQRAPTTNINNSTTSMLTTATQAIDTAFNGTTFSHENANGGCGGGSGSMDNDKKKH